MPDAPAGVASSQSNVVPGTELFLNSVPAAGGGGGASGWSSAAFGPPPDLYDFIPQFPVVTGQSWYPAAAADPTDFSPFGLEELLMASMVDSQI
jgi:hypothetical protein